MNYWLFWVRNSNGRVVQGPELKPARHYQELMVELDGELDQGDVVEVLEAEIDILAHRGNQPIRTLDHDDIADIASQYRMKFPDRYRD